MFTPDFLKDLRVLFVEDEELAREKLAKLLSKLFKEVVLASNGLDGLEKYQKSKATNEKIDLIISDISMPELSGFEAITTLSDNNKNIKVLFLSMFAGDDYIYHCIKAGGCGLLSKDSPKEELLFAIELISKGKRYFGKALPEEKIFQFVKDYEKNLSKEKITKKPDFTEQEISVLLLVAEGQTSSDIADKLFISKRTVDSHRANIIHKLGLRTGPQLLKYAIKFSEEYKIKTP